MIFDPPGPLLRGGDTDVSDLTDSQRTGPAYWEDGALVLPFDVDPTPAEQALICRRLMTRDAAHETWVGAVSDALAAIPETDPCRPLLVLLVSDALRGIDNP